MAQRIPLPNGATFQVAATLNGSKPITSVTNASPAVVTSAAHGLQAGDIVMLESGWDKLDGRAARVATVTTDSFVLENIDTTNLSFYPAGSGAGSFVKVATRVEIQKITGVSMSGGEQQFLNVGYLAEDDDRQFPTNRNPISMQLTVEDRPTAAYVKIVEGYSDNKLATVGVLNLPSGGLILYAGFVSITDTPTLERNQLMTRTVTFSMSGRSTRYVAA